MAARRSQEVWRTSDTYNGALSGTTDGGRGVRVRNDPHPDEAVAPSSGREDRWAARPIWSSLLRVGIFVFPIACALFATSVARSVMPTPANTTDVVAWWIVLLGVGLAAALVAERLARRLLPLATLLRLSMLFPDRAPSRFKIARQAGSLRHLEAKTAAPDGDPGGTAAAILALVARLSTHDRRTRGHAERVRVYTDLIAEEMNLEEDDRYRLRWAALLHDIGKLSVDADVLNKTDELTDDEWDEIRRHPEEGLRQIAPLVEWLGPWAQTISHHHERWDGAGYPAGLAGEQIFLGARIVAVGDTYDTMTSVRSYKRPVATRAAREELVACAGSQFDPVVVRAFLAISLPRLLWATGPLSLLVNIPLLARLQTAGQVGISSAAQAITATAAAGVIVAGLVAPIQMPARATATGIERVEARSAVERVRGRDPRRDPGREHDRSQDRGKGHDHDGGRGGGEPDPAVQPPSSDGGTDPSPAPEPSLPAPEPSPSEPPDPKTSPAPPPNVATVPAVVGMKASVATAALKAAGFQVAVVRSWGSDPSQKNIVTAQSEPAGSELTLGSSVTITVVKFRNKG
jgi:HD-GYP domain-containing protein (c-di-GMP phosphodiesterase class II)